MFKKYNPSTILTFILMEVLFGVIGFRIGKSFAEKLEEEELRKTIEWPKEEPEKLEGADPQTTPFEKSEDFKPVKMVGSAKRRRPGTTDYQIFFNGDKPQLPLEKLVEQYSSPEQEAKEPEYDPGVILFEVYVDPASNGFKKNVLTYWEGDDTLVNEDETPIPNSDEIIGDALLHFGEGSGDPDTVYVRNIKIGEMFEIVRKKASFASMIFNDPPAVQQKKSKRKARDE